MNLLGGDISVTSTAGKGSVFSFFIRAKVVQPPMVIGDKYAPICAMACISIPLVEQKLKTICTMYNVQLTCVSAPEQITSNFAGIIFFDDFYLSHFQQHFKNQFLCCIMREPRHLQNMLILRQPIKQSYFEALLDKFNGTATAVLPNMLTTVHGFEKFNVLVVEDNTVNQRVAVKLLQRMGIGHIEVAADGECCLSMLKKQSESDKLFHLILMDLQMPNIVRVNAAQLMYFRMALNVRGKFACCKSNKIQICDWFQARFPLLPYLLP